MPVALEMALLLLLLGGFWVQVVSPESPNMASWLTSTPGRTSASSVSVISETLNLNSEISTGPITRDPKEVDSTGSQSSNPPSSATFTASEMSHLQIFTGASPRIPVLEPTTSQEVSTEKSSVFPETSNATSDPPVTTALNSLGYTTVTNGTMTFDSLETSNVTNELSVAMATTSPEPLNETSGPSVTKATISLEPSNETNGPLVTMATISLEPSNETSGPPVTMTTSSLGTSSVTKGPPVSSIKTSASTTSSTNISTSTPAKSGSNGMLLVPVLVALLVVIVLLALLLLWRQRQKKRTGVLMLSKSGNRNGVVDAWAGPARVPDEEAMTTMVGGAGGNKDSVPETEVSGQRPTLTTFFSRRKSRQGSLPLEELKSGSSPNLKGEEEPLVGSEDEAVEAPTSNGPEAGDGAAPSRL